MAVEDANFFHLIARVVHSQARKNARAHSKSVVLKAAESARETDAISGAIYSHSSQLFHVRITDLSTVVHRVFQRVFRSTSCCQHTHLARSPHCSTRAINMCDNNLRPILLLRADSANSTLRTPRQNPPSLSLARSQAAPRSRAPYALQPTIRTARARARHIAARGRDGRAVGWLLVHRG